MADITSISPNPRIKCSVSNNIFYETWFDITSEETLDEKILLTGESTQCVCNHHVEQHCTRDHYNHSINKHCHGRDNLCNCKFFMARSVRLTHSNCYKMVTVRLVGDFEVLEGFQAQRCQ